jgi:hypothetical protein
MDDAEGVLEARVRQRLGNRPLDAVGAIEVRGRVEVTAEEDGDASRGERRETLKLVLEVGHAQFVLELEYLLDRGAVAELVGPVGVGGKVHVGDGHDTPGLRFDENVEPVGAGRVDDRVAGDDLRARAAVPAELLRERAGVHHALFEADDVGAGSADRGGDLVERLGAPGRVLAELPRLEVELVPAVEDVEAHDPQSGAAGWRARSGRRSDQEKRRRHEKCEQCSQHCPSLSSRGGCANPNLHALTARKQREARAAAGPSSS